MQRLTKAEIVTDFFSDLKSASSGFASFDYEEAGYEASDLVKVSFRTSSHELGADQLAKHDAQWEAGRCFSYDRAS